MLSPEVSTALDAIYGPIQERFTTTGTPEGGAPLEIRAQWIGIVLPVRALHAARLYYGYIGRRMIPLAEDHALDAITGERPSWPV
jgi:hypothetical protein